MLLYLFFIILCLANTSAFTFPTGIQEYPYYEGATFQESVQPYSARGSQFLITVKEISNSCFPTDNTYIACFVNENGNHIISGAAALPSNVIYNYNSCPIYLVPCSMKNDDSKYMFKLFTHNEQFQLDLNLSSSVYVDSIARNATEGFFNKVLEATLGNLSPPPNSPPIHPPHDVYTCLLTNGDIRSFSNPGSRFNIVDVSNMLSHVGGTTMQNNHITFIETCTDYNDDSSINIIDVSNMIEYVSRNVPKPPHLV